MALSGQAKTDYQREYMRKRRSNAGSNNKAESVRPEPLDPVRPDAGSIDIDTLAKVDAACGDTVNQDFLPEPQSHNPMMVGYVPPKVGE